MSTAETLSDLRCRIEAGYPLLLLRTFEEQRWEEELASLAGEVDHGLVTWTMTGGPLPPLDGDPPAEGVVGFLDQIVRYPSDHLFLLKDLHPYLAQPEVCRKLRDVIPVLSEHRKTLLLLSPVDTLPVELVKEVTVIDLPLPGPDEMRVRLREVLLERVDGTLSRRDEDRLVHSVLGLTLKEARNAYVNVLQGEERTLDELLARLVAEKRRLIQGSNLLEFFDLEEGIDDIGGLDGLKEWIKQRATAFDADASSRGISNPRGVLLAGVQGCGKSLSARATARILGFPLVRLELGSLLESTRGGSEQNLRDVLRLMETISPAVLWLEEIDKAFAGFMQESHADATVSRLVGRFLTWLQEHTAPVFVVATANNVARLAHPANAAAARRRAISSILPWHLPCAPEIDVQRCNWLRVP